jgi:hypothetical protein
MLQPGKSGVCVYIYTHKHSIWGPSIHFIQDMNDILKKRYLNGNAHTTDYTIYSGLVFTLTNTVLLFQYMWDTHTCSDTWQTEVADEGYFQLTISELWELSTSSVDVDLGPSLPRRRFILRIGVVGQPVDICNQLNVTQDCASRVIIKITVLLSTAHSIRTISITSHQNTCSWISNNFQFATSAILIYSQFLEIILLFPVGSEDGYYIQK